MEKYYDRYALSRRIIEAIHRATQLPASQKIRTRAEKQFVTSSNTPAPTVFAHAFAEYIHVRRHTLVVVIGVVRIV